MGQVLEQTVLARARVGMDSTLEARSVRTSLSTVTIIRNSKYLKVCQCFEKFNPLIDEIPIVLLELNESALAFITRDQFEKALLLLQKAHGVLDVVDISNCKRDQMIAIEIFYNMALCY